MSKENKKIKLAVFDWAGTTVDFGSQAPVQIFDLTFKSFGLNFTKNQINAPMGMEKKAHIRTMLSSAEGKKLWLDAKNRDWNENDINEIYEKFEENLDKVVGDYSRVIEGTVSAIEALRKDGIKIASDTGYTSQIMKNVLPVAKEDGYEPDYTVTPDICGGFSRPAPFMLYECMKKTGVNNIREVVKIGDTVVDILEGKNAGCWTVGLLKGSSMMGLSEEEYKNASPKEIEEKKAEASLKYFNAGADFVIDSISDLPSLIKIINLRNGAEE